MIILCVFLILILIILYLCLCSWMAGYVMTGERQTFEEAFKWQSDHYDTSYYESLEKTDYSVEGENGYILHVQFLKNPVATDRYMLLSHGYTDNRFGSLKYVKMYLDYGFNCIIYDLRGHGENERTFTTYGILEAKDLCRIIDDSKKRYPDVDFVVADCGFSDIENVIRGAYKSAGLPSGLFNIADFGARLRCHYSLKDMRPIDSLSDNKVPVLFIHGAQDDFILPKNSEDMKNATKGYAEFYTIPGAGHAESVLADTDAYRDHVKRYIEKILQ